MWTHGVNCMLEADITHLAPHIMLELCWEGHKLCLRDLAGNISVQLPASKCAFFSINNILQLRVCPAYYDKIQHIRWDCKCVDPPTGLASTVVRLEKFNFIFNRHERLQKLVIDKDTQTDSKDMQKSVALSLQGTRIISIADYQQCCAIHSELPPEPAEFFLDFTNIVNELGLSSLRRQQHGTFVPRAFPLQLSKRARRATATYYRFGLLRRICWKSLDRVCSCRWWRIRLRYFQNRRSGQGSLKARHSLGTVLRSRIHS